MKRLWWVTLGSFTAWLAAGMDHDVKSALAITITNGCTMLLFALAALWCAFKRVKQVVDEQIEARGGK